MDTRIKNLKITLTITDNDTDEIIWTDWSLGDTKGNSFGGIFESIEESLGKVERNLEMILERDYKLEEIEEDEEHDCPLVGGRGAEGCDNPIHEKRIEKEAEKELIESKNL